MPKTVSKNDFCSLAETRDEIYAKVQLIRMKAFEKKKKKGNEEHFNYGSKYTPSEEGSKDKTKA